MAHAVSMDPMGQTLGLERQRSGRSRRSTNVKEPEGRGFSENPLSWPLQEAGR